MSQVTFYDYYKVMIQKTNVNYYTARNASSGDEVFSICSVGQYFSAPTYGVRRGFVFFDTSGLPDDAVITAATLNIAVNVDSSDTDFIIKLRGAENVGSTVVEADYNLNNYIDKEDLGASAIAQYGLITLNSNGYDYISKTGITKFVLLSQEDINNDPPTGFEFITYKNDEASLVITYFEPTGTPEVDTLNTGCEDRQSTTLTAIGEVTSINGGYTYRGFEYFEYSDTNIYDSEMYAVREIGRFDSTGEFRMTLYGLKPSTVYNIRAFAGNVYGIDYGEWVLCSTIAGSPSTYDVYTEPNTARYRLYVSDDEAIAWRGYKGPYSGKQTLINISDITNKTKGIKVLKVDLPDAGTKGNFHVCITVKQELKGLLRGFHF